MIEFIIKDSFGEKILSDNISADSVFEKKMLINEGHTVQVFYTAGMLLIFNPAAEVMNSVKESDELLVNIIFRKEDFTLNYLPEVQEIIQSNFTNREAFILDITLTRNAFYEITGKRSLNGGKEFLNHQQVREISPQIRNVITDMMQCSFTEQYKNIYLKAKVCELIVLILYSNSFDSASYPWREPEKVALEKIAALISGNLFKSYSIEELAIIAGMNRTKLQAKFKVLFGKTIFNYTNDLKMHQAKLYLSGNRDYSLKEVALMVGYNHTNHFSAAFKKKFSFSPSAFKKNC